MNELISIIVPVYNIEQYVEECVRSLMFQTYKNIEILLIDDYSTDRSSDICKELSSEDNRVKLIQHETNKGVSAARNTGIDNAKGRYFLFVDGDDVVDSHLCEIAIKKIHSGEQVDTVHWGFWKFTDKIEDAGWKREPIMNNQEIVYQPLIINEFLNYLTVSYNDIYNWLKSGKSYHEAIHSKKHGGFVWRYLFSREVIAENNIRFFTDVRYGEDLLFLNLYLIHCKGIAILNEFPYYYRMRQGSAMHEKRSVNDKIISLTAKERVLNEVPQSFQEKFREKYQGQTILIILNAARLHNLKEYLLLAKTDCVQSALAHLNTVGLPFKYRVVFNMLKKKLYFLYWICIRILMIIGYGGIPSADA